MGEGSGIAEPEPALKTAQRPRSLPWCNCFQAEPTLEGKVISIYSPKRRRLERFCPSEARETWEMVVHKEAGAARRAGLKLKM